ncbi:Cof-type HAD-IIB family hydrolase [Paenibacillus sp. YAF4_2]|uniref:Cof-type HAD-IIB family hydrolase n=1 Tax=Paenibacillus sp. YAF4_2 TaxID=3233085 RepID=UPI003F97643B
MTLQYDLIALDVDGTLLTDDHQLTSKTREAVREAAERGAGIVLCTGRAPVSVFPVLEELGLNGIIITHNGGATINSDTRTIIHQYEIAPQQLEPYLAYCRTNQVHFDLNTAFSMMVESMTPELEDMYSKFHAAPSILERGTQLPEGLVKFTIFGDKEEMDRVQKDWEQWPPSLLTIRSGDFFIDVHHPEASKGRALQQFALSQGIDRSRILAIGNYFNDISMLEFAGCGIAMGNSPDGVKEAADVIARSNAEDGVAHALREFAWS